MSCSYFQRSWLTQSRGRNLRFDRMAHVKTCQEVKEFNDRTDSDAKQVLPQKIGRTFKATPITVVEVKTYIVPIDVHLDQLQSKPRATKNKTGPKNCLQKLV